MAEVLSHIETTNGGGGVAIIDDDIQHTVGKLLHIRPQHNNMVKNKKESLEEMMSRALQAERNHWKDRLQMSLHEIDRQHRIILTAQSGLQDIVKTLKQARQRSLVIEEEEEEEEADQEVVMSRLLEYLKFQIRQMKIRAGMTDTTKVEFEENQLKQKQNIKELKESIAKLTIDRDGLEEESNHKDEKIKWLKRENASLNRQLKKAQGIIERYNENHSGSNFHLKIVEGSSRGQRSSTSTLNEHENSISTITERTYVEGDHMGSYPDPTEESALIKDRIKKNIYSARKGDQRSSAVAMCFRCQTLFRPPENNHKACRFHHKGREITEQFGAHGKLDKVVYKWACCKKPLEAPGCCYGYHV